jgi:type I restriction enzyme, S subunit
MAARLSDLVTSQRAGYWGEDAGALDLDVSVIRNGDVHETGEIWWPTVPLRGFRAIEADKARIGRDDIVITTSADCGRVAHIAVEPPTVTCASNFVRVLRFDASRVNPRYVFHFMHRAQFATSLAPFIRGTAMKNLALADALSHVELPLPSIPEQIRISRLLDRADALRAKRRAALAQLDTLTQSIFLDMFGDPATNPKGWPWRSLKQCTRGIQIGPFGSLLHQGDYVSGGVPLINPMHIRDGTIVPDHNQSVTAGKHAALALYHLRQGDVIMGRRGEMGRCAIVGPEHDGFVCGTGSLFIRPDLDSATTLYLAAVLSSAAIRRKLERASLGATLPNLNRGIVENLEVPVPGMNHQRDFANRVEAVERLKSAQIAALAESDVLFASLQHRAFRGQL